MTAVYTTIWLALLLLCAGEYGRAGVASGGRPPRWAWWAYATGATIAAVHVALAMAIAHGWSHASAIAATARQTHAVYGLDWGGGVYANYAFVGVWLVEAWRWRLRPDRRADGFTWTVRIFFLIMIANAAVVFAAGWRRLAGAAITAALAGIYVASEHRERARRTERAGEAASE